jgi:hypothetical protein
MLWRRRHLPDPRGFETTSATLDSRAGPARRLLPRIILVAAALAIGAGLYWWSPGGSLRPAAPAAASGAPFATRTANGLTVNFYQAGGALSLAGNDVLIEFRDSASGAPVDAGTVRFDLDMNMPGMAMHSGATISPAGGTGRYLARIKPEMAGDWTAQLKYGGPHGPGELSFTVSVRP